MRLVSSHITQTDDEPRALQLCGTSLMRLPNPSPREKGRGDQKSTQAQHMGDTTPVLGLLTWRSSEMYLIIERPVSGHTLTGRERYEPHILRKRTLRYRKRGEERLQGGSISTVAEL